MATLPDGSHIVACEECGVIQQAATKQVGDLLREVHELKESLAIKESALRDLEVELRAKRSQISRMKGERDVQPEMDPYADEAWEVFRYWQMILAPRAREFTGKRWDNVIARLRAGHTVDELKRAIDGCALRPYVTQGRTAEGLPSQRQADLELICRDEEKLERFISYVEAEEAERHQADLLPPTRVALMQNMIDQPVLLARLRQLRGWTAEAILSLGLGLEGERVVFLAYDADGRLAGFSRYQPNPEKRTGPKNVAQGSRELFPPPETLNSTTCWLVEGEPDAVATTSLQLPAVAVPGVNVWKEEWAARFQHFERVYICFDCDEQGRAAAEIRASQLRPYVETVIIDLDPSRSDGWDIGDMLIERGESTGPALVSLATVMQGRSINGTQPRLNQTPPFDQIKEALEKHGCKVTERGPHMASSTCSNHDDQHPSLSLSEGDDGRVLLHCHAGCTVDEIVSSLGLRLAQLFEMSG